MINILADTKAHEKLLCVQGPNSLSGCYYCWKFPGVTMKKINQRIYYDHRIFLNKNSKMRNKTNSKYKIINVLL